MEKWVNALCLWYDQNKRNLPWRENKEPYRIWISEIMLQQTQVVTVIDYFNRFMVAFPDVYALAEASEEEVMTYWQGLGYYSRARNLKRCAIEIVNKYDGVFPKDYKMLLKLPGIGPYTAGAIASIAYDQRVPAVDGNVMRVMSRLKMIDSDLSDSKTNRIFFEYVEKVMPKRTGDFSQALMELGATVCTPKAPKCNTCPIKNYCKAYQEDCVMTFPVKTKRIKQKKVSVAMAVLAYKDTVLFMKQVETNLLNGLWVLPYVSECEDKLLLRQEMVDRFEIEPISEGHVLGSYRHVYTHLKWEITLYRYEIKSPKVIDFPEVSWINKDDVKSYPLPTVIQKALKFDIF